MNLPANGGLEKRVPRRAFTVLELLVVLAVVAILASLLFPALSRSRESAWRVQCVDHLHQLGLAAQFYWEDHDGLTFRYFSGSTNGGRLYWFGWLKPGAEGEREFDARPGALYPYLESRGVAICPSFDYSSTIYKYKARGAATDYGYNLYLGEHCLSVSLVACPSDTALFSDAAQVNDFQSPATPEKPLLEEFYYVDADEGAGYPNAHFRHQHRANVVCCDGHVGQETPVPNSLDSRLPGQWVGRLRPACLRLR